MQSLQDLRRREWQLTAQRPGYSVNEQNQITTLFCVAGHSAFIQTLFRCAQFSP